jgi:hypothetical protein
VKLTAPDLEHADEVTLELDLLETSDAVRHRDVARFQLLQARRIAAVEETAAQWAVEEMAKGRDEGQVQTACFEHIRETREKLHEETVRFVLEQGIIKEERDRMISLFCLDHE